MGRHDLFLLLQLAICFQKVTGDVIAIPVEKEVETPANHVFEWKNAADSAKYGTADFLSFEKSDKDPGDFYEIFTGDTQYYYPCTIEHFECQKICSDGSRDCKIQQSRYANQMQLGSMKALIQKMGTDLEYPRGVIINGDITDFGHPFELRAFQLQWGKGVNGIKIYPGLGNHDIQNNVGECATDHCANRMMRWFTKFVKKNLKLRVDYGTKSNFWGLHTEYEGSFAYSWNECQSNDGSKCVHFVQLNNYPTYETRFNFPIAKWTINSALDWLQRDLSANKNYPVVINYHLPDPSYGYSLQDQEKFKKVLENSNLLIYGIFIGHHHSRTGVRQSWCINGRKVPTIYSGSVPANNYMLIRFTDNDYVPYMMHVVNGEKTTVERLVVEKSC